MEVKKLSAAYVEQYTKASAAYVKIAEAKDKAKAYAQANTYNEEYDDDDDANDALLLEMLGLTIEIADTLALAATALEIREPDQSLALEVRIEIYRLVSRGLIDLDRFWSTAWGWGPELHLSYHLQAAEAAYGHGATSMMEDFELRAAALRAFYRQVEGWVQGQV